VTPVFVHVKGLENQAMPERPNPIYDEQLQEIIGGQFGEMTVTLSCLFQGWNSSASTAGGQHRRRPAPQASRAGGRSGRGRTASARFRSGAHPSAPHR
jgi:hypothetical protein